MDLPNLDNTYSNRKTFLAILGTKVAEVMNPLIICWKCSPTPTQPSSTRTCSNTSSNGDFHGLNATPMLATPLGTLSVDEVARLSAGVTMSLPWKHTL